MGSSGPLLKLLCMGCGKRLHRRLFDRPVGLVYDEAMERHTGPEHVEQPQRIIQIWETLSAEGLMQRCTLLPPAPASDAELHLVHPPTHVQNVSVSRSLFPHYDARRKDLIMMPKTKCGVRCGTCHRLMLGSRDSKVESDTDRFKVHEH